MTQACRGEKVYKKRKTIVTDFLSAPIERGHTNMVNTVCRKHIAMWLRLPHGTREGDALKTARVRAGPLDAH